jgi:hypothetical protein
MRDTQSLTAVLAACWRRVEESLFASMAMAALPGQQVRGMNHLPSNCARLAHGR